MLERLSLLWWRLKGRLAGRRHRAFVRRLAAGDPVEALLTELGIEADSSGIETLTARQQLVLRPWVARGVIGNGGFRFFLECELPLGPAAEGFRELGFEAAAAACERVMARMAAAPALGEEARRASVLEAGGHDAFDGEDCAVFDVDWDRLKAAIGEYMRRHPRDFPGLPPAGGAARREG